MLVPFQSGFVFLAILSIVAGQNYAFRTNSTLLPGETFAVAFPQTGTLFNLSNLAGSFTISLKGQNQTVDPSRYEILLSGPVVFPYNLDKFWNLRQYFNTRQRAGFNRFDEESIWVIIINSLSDALINFEISLEYKISSPRSPSNLLSYNQNLAHKLLLLSSAAYLDNPNNCGFVRNSSVVIHMVFSQDLNIPLTGGFKAKIFGYLALDQESRQIIVVFRGTPGNTLVGILQFLHEVLKSNFVPIRGVHNGEELMEYFLIAAEAILFTDHINDFQRTLVELTTQFPDYQVIFTGHSLGGALASATAFMTSLVKNNVLKRGLFAGGVLQASRKVPLVYTFGEPRIGNYYFAQTFNKMIPIAYRVTHGEDMAPHFPPCRLSMGCGTASLPGPFRQGVQVHYKPFTWNAPYRVCLPEFCQDKPACSYWPTFDNPCAAHHAQYFGIYVGTACLQRQGVAF